MSAMRKAISKGMTHSYLTAPTFTLNYDVDMTNLMALRKQVLDPIMNKTGMKVTFTDLIGLAVVRTLMKEEHRYLNASLIDDAQNIELHKFVNLGIAVGLDDGLIVPVVHGADKMSLSEFVVASKDVIKKAQAGKLRLLKCQVQPSLLLTWECLELSHLTQSSTNQTQLSLVFQQLFKLQLLLMEKLSYVQSWVYA